MRMRVCPRTRLQAFIDALIQRSLQRRRRRRGHIFTTDVRETPNPLAGKSGIVSNEASPTNHTELVHSEDSISSETTNPFAYQDVTDSSFAKEARSLKSPEGVSDSSFPRESLSPKSNHCKEVLQKDIHTLLNAVQASIIQEFHATITECSPSAEDLRSFGTKTKKWGDKIASLQDQVNKQNSILIDLRSHTKQLEQHIQNLTDLMSKNVGVSSAHNTRASQTVVQESLRVSVKERVVQTSTKALEKPNLRILSNKRTVTRVPSTDSLSTPLAELRQTPKESAPPALKHSTIPRNPQQGKSFPTIKYHVFDRSKRSALPLKLALEEATRTTFPNYDKSGARIFVQKPRGQNEAIISFTASSPMHQKFPSILAMVPALDLFHGRGGGHKGTTRQQIVSSHALLTDPFTDPKFCEMMAVPDPADPNRKIFTGESVKKMARKRGDTRQYHEVPGDGLCAAHAVGFFVCEGEQNAALTVKNHVLKFWNQNKEKILDSLVTAGALLTPDREKVKTNITKHLNNQRGHVEADLVTLRVYGQAYGINIDVFNAATGIVLANLQCDQPSARTISLAFQMENYFPILDVNCNPIFIQHENKVVPLTSASGHYWAVTDVDHSPGRVIRKASQHQKPKNL